MATWMDIDSEVPEFAARVRRIFESGTNKTLATLRRDGSPRISGTELEFELAADMAGGTGTAAGRVTLGMMPGSRKLADVQRDPRVAIHSPTLEPPKDDPNAWIGDAKLAGTLISITQPAAGPPGAYFELDITEVVLTYVIGDELVVESWHPHRGWRRMTRT